MTEKPERKKGLKADYKGATPEQVGEAVLRYRPDHPVRHADKAEKPSRPVNPDM